MRKVVVRSFFVGVLKGIQYLLVICYVVFWLSSFTEKPHPIDLIAGPLSFLGLWMLFFHFDKLKEVVRGWRRHE